MSWFLLHFWGTVLPDTEFLGYSFSFHHLNMTPHCLLESMVSGEKFAMNPIKDPLRLITSLLISTFSCCLLKGCLWYGESLWVYPNWKLTDLLGCVDFVFCGFFLNQIGEVFYYYFFNYSSCLLLPSPSRTPIMCVSRLDGVSQVSVALFIFHHSLFSVPQNGLSQLTYLQTTVKLLWWISFFIYYTFQIQNFYVVPFYNICLFTDIPYLVIYHSHIFL